MTKLDKKEVQLLDVAVQEYWCKLGTIGNSLQYDPTIKNAIEIKRKELDDIRLKLSLMFVEAFVDE
jgi:hypothetical protein